MTQHRIIGLDLIRLAAILLVLGRHMTKAPSEASAKWLFDAWKRGGWVGVDLFFVLSGYLVAGLLFHEYDKRGTLSMGRFLFRRAGKILPPFLALIVFTVAVRYVLKRGVDPTAVVAELTFTQSYFQGLWPHTWSLSVEEIFYITLPVMLLLVISLNRNAANPFAAIPLIAAIATLACLFLRLAPKGQYDNHSHLFNAHLRIDALLLGVAIAYVVRYRWDSVAKLRPYRHAFIAIGSAMFAPAFLLELESTPFLYTYGLTMFFVGAGFVLVGVVLCDQPTSRVAIGGAALGALSYSVYLWHMPVVYWLMPAAVSASGVLWPFEAQFAFYAALSFVVGAAMFYAVERPGVKLRDWLAP